jgi:hypothetical protein
MEPKEQAEQAIFVFKCNNKFNYLTADAKSTIKQIIEDNFKLDYPLEAYNITFKLIENNNNNNNNKPITYDEEFSNKKITYLKNDQTYQKQLKKDLQERLNKIYVKIPSGTDNMNINTYITWFLDANKEKYSNYKFTNKLFTNKNNSNIKYVELIRKETKTTTSTDEYYKIFGKLPEMKENTNKLNTYTLITFVDNNQGTIETEKNYGYGITPSAIFDISTKINDIINTNSIDEQVVKMRKIPVYDQVQVLLRMKNDNVQDNGFNILEKMSIYEQLQIINEMEYYLTTYLSEYETYITNKEHWKDMYVFKFDDDTNYYYFTNNTINDNALETSFSINDIFNSYFLNFKKSNGFKNNISFQKMDAKTNDKSGDISYNSRDNILLNKSSVLLNSKNKFYIESQIVKTNYNWYNKMYYKNITNTGKLQVLPLPESKKPNISYIHITFEYIKPYTFDLSYATNRLNDKSYEYFMYVGKDDFKHITNIKTFTNDDYNIRNKQTNSIIYDAYDIKTSIDLKENENIRIYENIRIFDLFKSLTDLYKGTQNCIINDKPIDVTQWGYPITKFLDFGKRNKIYFDMDQENQLFISGKPNYIKRLRIL